MSHTYTDDEIDLKKIYFFLKKYKEKIIASFLLFLFLGSIVYFITPKKYQSSIVFIENSQDIGSPLSGLFLSNSSSSSFNKLNILLESKNYKSKVINQYILETDKTLDFNQTFSKLNLNKNLTMKKEANGSIRIKYISRNPEECKIIVTLCLKELLLLYNNLNFSSNKEIIKTIDTAYVPESPFSPNFKNFLLLFSIIGLIVGTLLSLYIETKSSLKKVKLD